MRRVEHAVLDDHGPVPVNVIPPVERIAQGVSGENDETGLLEGVAVHGRRMPMLDVKGPDGDVLILKDEVFVAPGLEDDAAAIVRWLLGVYDAATLQERRKGGLVLVRRRNALDHDSVRLLPKKRKGLRLLEGPFILSRRRPTFPHSCPRSIIGDVELNCRVRNGNGCFLHSMITGNL